MAWTAPTTAVTNATITAALWNSDVRDNANYLKGRTDVADYKEVLDCITADGSSVANTASETTVWTYAVPANTLGTNKAIRVWFYGKLQLTGADSVTFKLKYGGTIVGTCSITTEYSSERGIELSGVIRANAATNAQRGALLSSGLTQTLGTATVDSTSSQNAILTVQFGGASASKNFILYMALAELYAAV